MNKNLSIAMTMIVVATSLIACKQEETAPPAKPVKVNFWKSKTIAMRRNSRIQEPLSRKTLRSYPLPCLA